MEINELALPSQLKKLNTSLINHLWIFPIISVMNLILGIKMYFIYKAYQAFYLICTIIFILFIFIPVYPIILLKRNLFIKKAKYLKKISFINIFIILFFGILMNLMAGLNIWVLFLFYKECPYNFTYNDISKLFNIKYSEDNKENMNYNDYGKCSENRCLLLKENNNPVNDYYFLCNFDSSFDFQSLNNKIVKTFFGTKINNNSSEIICDLFMEEEFDNFTIGNDEELYVIKSYFNICSSKNDFYKCVRYEKPKKYEIKFDFTCPVISDNIVCIIIEIIAFTFNIVVSLVITSLEYIIQKKIVELLNIPTINPEGASTRGNTKFSSRNKSNINNQNNDNEINSQTLIVEGHASKKEEINFNHCNDINIVNINPNEGIIAINKINDDDIHKNIQINEINNDNSDRNNKLININDINARNETAINYNNINTGNSINNLDIYSNENKDNHDDINVINIYKKG
jgi:hypothetical protein